MRRTTKQNRRQTEAKMGKNLWKKKKSCLKKKKIRKECEEMRKFRQMKKDDFRGRVDDVFLVVFPIMFLIFNLLYWPLCLQTEVK